MKNLNQYKRQFNSKETQQFQQQQSLGNSITAEIEVLSQKEQEIRKQWSEEEKKRERQKFFREEEQNPEEEIQYQQEKNKNIETFQQLRKKREELEIRQKEEKSLALKQLKELEEQAKNERLELEQKAERKKLIALKQLEELRRKKKNLNLFTSQKLDPINKREQNRIQKLSPIIKHESIMKLKKTKEGDLKILKSKLRNIKRLLSSEEEPKISEKRKLILKKELKILSKKIDNAVRKINTLENKCTKFIQLQNKNLEKLLALEQLKQLEEEAEKERLELEQKAERKKLLDLEQKAKRKKLLELKEFEKQAKKERIELEEQLKRERIEIEKQAKKERIELEEETERKNLELSILISNIKYESKLLHREQGPIITGNEKWRIFQRISEIERMIIKILKQMKSLGINPGQNRQVHQKNNSLKKQKIEENESNPSTFESLPSLELEDMHTDSQDSFSSIFSFVKTWEIPEDATDRLLSQQGIEENQSNPSTFESLPSLELEDMHTDSQDSFSSIFSFVKTWEIPEDATDRLLSQQGIEENQSNPSTFESLPSLELEDIHTDSQYSFSSIFSFVKTWEIPEDATDISLSQQGIEENQSNPSTFEAIQSLELEDMHTDSQDSLSNIFASIQTL